MPQVGETELDVGVLARALWRKAWLLLLLAIAAAALTYGALSRVKPLYSADTSILIEERESPLTRTREETNSTGADFDESAIQSQVEVLRSREIAGAVIDKLDLTRKPGFDPAAEPSLKTSLLVMLGLSTPPTDASVRQRVMDRYYERLSVYPVQKSRVVGVSFSAANPQTAADVANAVADSFVRLQQGAKRDSAVAATEWLQQEIERLRARVADAEQAVASYRSGKGLFDIGQSGSQSGQNTTLSSQQLSEINAELARARAARAEAEARAQSVEALLHDGGDIGASQDVLNSQLIQRLQERQVALRAQIAELSTTLLPGHPRIRSLGGQLGNLEDQIRQEAQKVLASLKTAARIAAAREQSLVTSLDSAKADASRSGEEGIELRALERESAAQRDLLESFLARYREAVARTDADYLPADARIISRAVAPQEPSYPKKGMMSVAAALVALILGAMILLVREFSSGRAFRVIGYMPPAMAVAAPAADVVALARPAEPVPAVATAETVAPVVPPEPTADPESAAPAESPDLAETAVPAEIIVPAAGAPLAVLDDEPAELAPAPAVGGDRAGTVELAEILASDTVRIVLFAGAEGGEGAGDIAFATARHAARNGVRLVVVDLGATPAEVLGGTEKPGLGDLLGGEAAFGEVIRRDEASRVHFIPVGDMRGEPPLQRLRIVIGALTHTYDKVVVVADRLSSWPEEHVTPDLAAIVCGPDTTEGFRTEIYEAALSRGAASAVIVRYTSGGETGVEESAAA